MAYDLGDVATLAIQIKDSTGALANAGTVVATITAPDGTTSIPSVTNTTTGNYSVAFTATQVGRHGIRWVATGANAGAYTDVFEILDPAYLPLVSLADAKTHMAVTATTTDETVRYILARATGLAEDFTGRALVRATKVETFDGGKEAVMLREPPVLTVTSVVENTTTLTTSDYVVDLLTGALYRGSTLARILFFPGVQNITVTYVAGYANPPLGVQQGVLDIARWIYQQSQQGPRPGFGQSAQDYAGLGSDALPKWLFRPLEAYVMPGIA